MNPKPILYTKQVTPLPPLLQIFIAVHQPENNRFYPRWTVKKTVGKLLYIYKDIHYMVI